MAPILRHSKAPRLGACSGTNCKITRPPFAQFLTLRTPYIMKLIIVQRAKLGTYSGSAINFLMIGTCR